MTHESYDSLREKLKEASQRVPMEFYEHYKKGDIYCVVGYCILEMTDKVGIQYIAAEEPAITWVKPIDDWLEPVTVNDAQVERFMRAEY
jgi:hypothetical protein